MGGPTTRHLFRPLAAASLAVLLGAGNFVGGSHALADDGSSIVGAGGSGWTTPPEPSYSPPRPTLPTPQPVPQPVPQPAPQPVPQPGPFVEFPAPSPPLTSAQPSPNQGRRIGTSRRSGNIGRRTEFARGLGYDPAPSVFRFSVGDTIRISIEDADSETGTIETIQRILRDGTIAPHWIDPVQVAGRSIGEVRAILREAYKEFYDPLNFTVSVVSIHNERAFVLGEVRNPTSIDLNGPVSAIQGLALAGGAVPGESDLSRVRLIRATSPCVPPQVFSLNMTRIMCGRQGTVMLQPGDVLYVQPRGVVDWARDLNRILTPITSVLGGVGGVATTALAIDQLNKSDGSDTIIVGGG